ncbi:hypothetical protein [Pedobacter xixiisoli]|nr:hypothetical protein [Pedobacter xixiisoli]
MRTTLIIKKLPQLFDCALALAISSVPGIAETNGQTKALYKALAKQLLAEEIRSKRAMAIHTLHLLTRGRHGQHKSAA